MDQSELSNAMRLVVPGDFVSEAQGLMSGHGTYESQNNIYASLAGIIHQRGK